MSTDNKFLKVLVGYFGILQVIHLIVLIRGGILVLNSGAMGFPASPPPGGWSNNAMHFLFIMGIVDFLNALASLLFVYGYFRKLKWRYWLGRVVLTVVIISAVTYAYAVLMAGALAEHPVEYIVVAAVFVPAILLAGLFNSSIFTSNKSSD